MATSSFPQIIILHGWTIDPASRQKWQVFTDLLKQKGFSIDFLNIPGLSAPLHEVWNLENYTQWLEEKLAGKKNVILLGHSFGGQIAVRYTATHPGKVNQLILVDSSGIRDHSFKATAKRVGFRFAAKIGKFFFRTEFFRTLLYKLARERDYQNAPPLLRRTMSQILDDEVVKDLPNITCPALIIWGEEDKVTPLFLGQVFKDKIPNNEFKTIQNARHSPQYTHPQQVADAVAQFMTKQKGEQ
jgi:pimeloyl-ACP methyl ester carboxylesterase